MSSIIAPIKKTVWPEKRGNEHEPLIARDYATEPTFSENDSDLSVISSNPVNTPSDPHKVTTLEDYPLLPSDATTSQTNVNILDAQAELRSARIAEKTEDEEDEEEGALSDAQLRRLYEDEEVERFLTVFATEVNEITLVPTTQDEKPKTVRIVRSTFSDGRPGDTKLVPIQDDGSDSDAETDTDEPWTYLDPNNSSDASTTASKPTQESRPGYKPPRYLSARVAAFLVSKLPSKPIAPPAKFRLGAVRLAGQRVYFSTYPFYASFVVNLMNLAAWSNWHRSARICAVWWILWWFNMLLPALFGKILYALLRRGVMRNPTLKELRKRRKIAQEADDLADTMEGHGAAASFLGTGSVPGAGQGGGDMGLRDLLKLTKLITIGKGKKGKEKVKEVASSVAGDTDEDDAMSTKEKEDWRNSTLKAMEDCADLHERVRNLFIWRRERSSRIYALVLIFLTLAVAVTPAQILAKLLYAAIGFLYWFGVPVLLAIPPGTLKHLPPPLADVPSDAEYAINLISVRVAHGESIIPASRRRRRQHGRARRYVANLNPAVSGPGDITRNVAMCAHDQSVEEMREEANEKEALVAEEQAATRGMQVSVTSEEVAARENAAPNAGPMERLKQHWEATKADLKGTKDEPQEELRGIGAPQTVPANHKATPGSLTLDSEAVSFTTLLASSPRRIIPLEKIQGVKKANHTNGLRIRYKDDNEDEREIVFRFIPNRDEIFAKLVGWGGNRWRKV